MHPEFVNHLGGVFELSSPCANGTGVFEQNMHWSLFGNCLGTCSVQETNAGCKTARARSLSRTTESISPLFICWGALNHVHIGEPISKIGLELIFSIWPDDQLCQNATPGHVHQPSSGPETNPDEVPLLPCFKKRSYKRPPTPFRNRRKSPHCFCCYPQLLAPCASLALLGAQFGTSVISASSCSKPRFAV